MMGAMTRVNRWNETEVKTLLSLFSFSLGKHRVSDTCEGHGTGDGWKQNRKGQIRCSVFCVDERGTSHKKGGDKALIVVDPLGLTTSTSLSQKSRKSRVAYMPPLPSLFPETWPDLLASQLQCGKALQSILADEALTGSQPSPI